MHADTLQQSFAVERRAVYSDLDDTLTTRDRELPDEVVEFLYGLLGDHIPVGIASARSLYGDHRGAGRQLNEVVTKIASMARESSEHGRRPEEVLRYLYLLPENGCYLVRADAPHNWLAQVGEPLARTREFADAIEVLLKRWVQSHRLSLTADTVGKKEFTLTLRQLPGDEQQRLDLKTRVERVIEEAQKRYVVLHSQGGIEVIPHAGGKRYGLTQFVARLAIDHPDLEVDEPSVVTLGDKGRRDGIDFAIVNRPAGYSVDETEPGSQAISLPETIGQRGHRAALYVLERVQFTQRKKI